jgi:hypothetical protein
MKGKSKRAKKYKLAERLRAAFSNAWDPKELWD